MSVLDGTATLAELVTEVPARAAVLDRMGLDYCCGGHALLADAVVARGLDLDVVIAALAQAAAPSPDDATWRQLGVVELIDHLVATHHAYLTGAFGRLEALAEKVASVHGERHPELGRVRELVRELRVDLEPHLQKEEQVLFPMVRALIADRDRPPSDAGALRGPISVMSAEHDRVGALLSELRAVSGGYQVPADGCNSYRALFEGLAELEADTHLHVHKENNVLFPAVIALSSPADRDESRRARTDRG